MRNPRNDTGSVETADGHEGPVRSCILTRQPGAREHLVRLALAPDGQIMPDIRAKAPGRGAYIGVDQPVLRAALAKGKLRGALSRALKTHVLALGDDLPERIEDALRRAALDRLGLEARGGTVLTGSERIAQAARGGKLHALYHAGDAGEDGCRKLDQAWRVGRDREGSDLQGLALPIPRSILSLALGRENVVHIGVTDRAAAKRVSDALVRWLHFIGPNPAPAPCGTAPRGSSTPTIRAAMAATTNEEFE